MCDSSPQLGDNTEDVDKDNTLRPISGLSASTNTPFASESRIHSL